MTQRKQSRAAIVEAQLERARDAVPPFQNYWPYGVRQICSTTGVRRRDREAFRYIYHSLSVQQLSAYAQAARFSKALVSSDVG